MSDQENNGFVKVLQKDQYGEVVFHHPKANSMTAQMLRALAEGIEGLAAKVENKSILLRSEGKHFCTGASFEELLKIRNPEEGVQFFMGFARVIAAMRAAPIPIVTLIQGLTVGGGVGIVGASDMVIAANEAQFKLSELKIGIGPFVISPILKAKMGNGSFSTMAFTPGDFFSSEWALSKGLVSKRVLSDVLSEEGEQKTAEFGNYSRLAITRLKSIGFDPELEGQMKEMAAMSAELVCLPETRAFLNEFLK